MKDEEGIFDKDANCSDFTERRYVEERSKDKVDYT